MIDTNELRRLAQAATSGPWYVTGKLTRYVEARIDGGLIQEVAACGPTKADGGYGPQQEANARLIAAANPATISELLDRLEAAEKDIALKEKVIDALGSELNAVANERDALREEVTHIKEVEFPRKAQAVADGWRGKCERLEAKIAEMEQQEPVAEWIENRFDQYPQLVWNEKYRATIGAKLYARPGAHPKLESSVPDGWKLVPIEPTTEIRKAMHYAYWQSPQLPYHDGSPELWNAAYAAMLEAAPEAKP